MSDQRYLTAPEAAAYLRSSARTLGERTRLHQIPFRRPPHSRRNLYLASELDRWIDGECDLERVDLPGNGVVVRFKTRKLAVAREGRAS